MWRVIVLEAVCESYVRSRLDDMWVGSRRTVATTPNDQYTARVRDGIEPAVPRPRLLLAWGVGSLLDGHHDGPHGSRA